MLSALGNKLMHGTPRKKPQREPMDLVDLRAATDAIAYEDWAVDYNQVRSMGLGLLVKTCVQDFEKEAWLTNMVETCG